MTNANVRCLLTGRVFRWITLTLVMITFSGPASASGAGEASTEPPATQEANHYVYNITDGMEGDLVQDHNSVFYGQRLVNGWKNSGLPWTYQVDPKRMVLPPMR